MPPSPQLYFQTVTAHHASAALKAALDLGLFGAFQGQEAGCEELAERLQIAPKGARVLCDYLCILGFLNKSGERYSLTEDSATFLVPGLPTYVGSTANFMFSTPLVDSIQNLREAVRKGGTALEQETVTPENPVWVEFARSMGPMMHPTAVAMAELVESPQQVLDIAAGHGLFGIAQAQRHPGAHITALDWPSVLEVARENATRAGLADRYRWLAGDAFQVDFEGPYDLVLLTNFLHHFDRATCVGLLKKVRAAMTDQGTLLTLEFIPNEDRISPPDRAAFSLIMLATTERGDAYTFSELDSMLAEAGFRRNELKRLPPQGDVVVSRV